MKKTIFLAAIALLSLSAPAQSATTPTSSAPWKPTAPEQYEPITWTKAPGVTTFFKSPSGNGALDFITRIYLPQNDIAFITATDTPQDWGAAKADFTGMPAAPNITNTDIPADDTPSTQIGAITAATAGSFRNYAFARIVAESSKRLAPSARFIWNGPFFNITVTTTDLSLALKTTIGTSTLISSGSRPPFDMAKPRRMLIVNNLRGTATIMNFDQALFVSSTLGDQAIEGFAPDVIKNDGMGAATERLFMGVTAEGKELVIYCSGQATENEASMALYAAGVPFEQQLEADGGSSTACGYNLPGQFFVEPERTLPILMGASTIVARGTASTDGLNVRKGPGTNNAIVRKLAKGEPVRAYEEKNGWLRIGTGEWVSKSLINATK